MIHDHEILSDSQMKRIVGGTGVTGTTGIEKTTCSVSITCDSNGTLSCSNDNGDCGNLWNTIYLGTGTEVEIKVGIWCGSAANNDYREYCCK
jgi:hypothetical protein